MWDYVLIRDRIGVYGNYRNWSTQLIAGLSTDEYTVLIPSWRNCSFESRPDCPYDWAIESDELNCALVYRGLEEDATLSQDYIANAVRIIEQRVIQGGVRLAEILNQAIHPAVVFPLALVDQNHGLWSPPFAL